ncbi:MAG TPA: ABC transporter ATP-binding protein [Frankiaceae bacterium]|nr:ABC transporter ATP-binding protein [Frankiaceae bacterium]
MTRTVLLLARRAAGARVWLLGALTLVGGLVPTASVLATGALVGAVPAAVTGGLGSPAGRPLLVALAVVAGLYVAAQALAPLTAALTWSVGSLYALAVRETVSTATLGPAGIAHLEDPELADEIAVVEGTEARPWVRQATIPALVTVTTTWLTGLGSAVVLARFRWWAPLLLGAAWAVTHRWVGREVETFTKSLPSATAELRRASYYRDLALRPAAAKELRVFGLGTWAVDRYAGEWLGGMSAIWRERRGHRLLMVQAVGAVALAHVVVLASIGQAAYDGALSVGGLAVYAQAVLGTMALGAQGDPQRTYREGAALAQRAVALATRIGPPAPGTGRHDLAGAPRRGIRFENVSFRYPGTERLVLDGLDLDVPAGRSLAVVGLNGAGKTTLVKLLTRLYEPTSGRITVDGVDLAEVDPEVWRERVGAVFQDFLRLELPARDNVGVGCARLAGDEAELAAAARDVGAEALVEALPRGWDTVLSRGYEGGADLSGGQWQRIALARALLAVRGGASVLVLDEPTANLDVRAEQELFDRVLASASGTTTLLVSHRLSSVRRVDRIVVVEDGRVAEEGSHDELMHLGGRYAALFALQAERFGTEVGADA